MAHHLVHHLLFIQRGDRFICSTESGAGFCLEPRVSRSSWGMTEKKGYIWRAQEEPWSDQVSGWSGDRDQALEEACTALVEMGVDITQLPSRRNLSALVYELKRRIKDERTRALDDDD